MPVRDETAEVARRQRQDQSGRHTEANASFDLALERTPYDAYVVSRAALGRFYNGEFDASIDLFQRAIRFDPLHADRQRGMLGHAYFHAGHYDRAIAELQTIDDPLVWELAWLACSQAVADHKGYLETAERYRALATRTTSEYEAQMRPFRNKSDMERLHAAMRAAGIAPR